MTSELYFILMIGVVLVSLFGYVWMTAQSPRLPLGVAAATMTLLSVGLAFWSGRPTPGIRPGVDPWTGDAPPSRTDLASWPLAGWPDAPPWTAQNPMAVARESLPPPAAENADVVAQNPPRPKPLRAKSKPPPPAAGAEDGYSLPTVHGCSTGNNRMCP